MLTISGGCWRGRRIKPPNNDKVRPTTGLVRESIFNRLKHYWGPYQDVRLLDGFAGSGIIGFEALSRGVAYVLAVEKNPKQVNAIRQVAERLKPDDGSFQLKCRSLESVVVQANQALPFDWVYLDPPYGYQGFQSLIADLAKGGWVKNHSLILVEQSVRDAELGMGERRNYGECSVTWVRGNELNSEKI